jgi:hypothetical protein
MTHDANHEYDENCKGCQPAMMDVKTGKVLPDDSPEMVAILKFFKEKLTLVEKRAWHRVCVQCSQNKDDLLIAQRIGFDIQQLLHNLK